MERSSYLQKFQVDIQVANATVVADTFQGLSKLWHAPCCKNLHVSKAIELLRNFGVFNRLKVFNKNTGWKGNGTVLDEEILSWVWIMKWWLICYSVASADTSVLDGAHDPKQEVSAVQGTEEQPAFKGNKGVRKYCLFSSRFLPF